LALQIVQNRSYFCNYPMMNRSNVSRKKWASKRKDVARGINILVSFSRSICDLMRLFVLRPAVRHCEAWHILRIVVPIQASLSRSVAMTNPMKSVADPFIYSDSVYECRARPDRMFSCRTDSRTNQNTILTP
jgi:hypothetical protein